MLKNNKVIFQGNGEIKEYHYLDNNERALVLKALYTKQAIFNGDYIIVGEDGLNKGDFY